jgi:hypothetical protein
MITKLSLGANGRLNVAVARFVEGPFLEKSYRHESVTSNQNPTMIPQ